MTSLPCCRRHNARCEHPSNGNNLRTVRPLLRVESDINYVYDTDNTTTSTDEQSHGNNDDEDDVEAEWQYRRATSDDDTLFYVLAPKDLVVARPRDLDDHVSWLLALQRYEAAVCCVFYIFCFVKT